MKALHKSLKKHQKGVILVASLGLLVSMTILGVAGLQSSGLQARLASNQSDTNAAFEAAEAALRGGESWVKDQISKPIAVSRCASHPCTVWEVDDPGNILSDSFQWSTVGQEHDILGSNNDRNGRNESDKLALSLATNPRYLIEEFTDRFQGDDLSPDARAQAQGLTFYRITGYGQGKTDKSESMVQSQYTTRY